MVKVNILWFYLKVFLYILVLQCANYISVYKDLKRVYISCTIQVLLLKYCFC